MSDIQALLETMQARFNPTAANGVDEVFQYDITDAGSWQVKVADGNCTLTQGTPDNASVTLSMNADTLQSVLNGETDGMQAFMSGDIKASGNVMLAMRLTDLFPQA